MNASAIRLRDFGWAALLVGASWALGLWMWSRLPAGGPVPVHWDVHGRVNGWGSPFQGAFIAPLVATGLLLLLAFLPRLDPRHANYVAFRGAYVALATVVVGFLLLVHALLVAQTLGARVDLGRWIAPLMGLLFAGLGLLMPRLGPNWFAGIRTPWTLDDDEVWRATHRVGGRLFLVDGLLGAAAGALAPPAWGIGILIAAVTAAAVGSVVYSYVAYRRLHPHAA